MNYHLIRNRDNAYWRPEGQGYTDKASEAGTYDEYTATQVVFDTHGEHRMEPIQSDEGSYILAANLENALEEALIAIRRENHETGYKGQSALVAGLEANLAYLRKHGTLEVRS